MTAAPEPDALAELLQRAEQLPPEQRRAFSFWARQEITRLRVARQYPTAGALAQALDPTTIQTADLRVIDEQLEWAFATPAARLMISKPSQTGKSLRVAVWGMVRALVRRPDWRIIVATHSKDLALTHSEMIRNILWTYGTGARDPLTGIPLPDRLGIGVGAKSAAGRWTIAGHAGGIVAAGTETSLPGKPADLLLLDDLYAGMAQADSPAERRRVNLWWDTVASQRPGPEAPVIMIGTRWHEQDAHGYLLQQMPGQWRQLNFPALAEHGVLDSLNREPGVPLENPRGRTDWTAIRDRVPARVWSAMYQGSPTPASGGLFNPAWFSDHRLDGQPPLYRRLVGVDPAETGQGDEAGIMAGGMAADGSIVLTDDWSGQYSANEWPRRAVLLALSVQADELVFEAYSAAVAYERMLKRAYEDLVIEAGPAGQVDGIRVPASRPFHISPWRRTGTALVRSTGLRHATSVGRCRVIEHRLATYEAHAIRWQETQHCPDRVAAAVIVYDVLSGGDGAQMSAPTSTGWGTLPDGMGFSTR